MHHSAAPSTPSSPARPGRRSTGSLAVLAALTAALMVGCERPPDPDEVARRAAVAAALDSVYAVFSEAYVRANVQLDEVYAEDGYYLPPDSPILRGQDQFRGQFSFLERYALGNGPGPEISFEIVDREIAGDLAYDIGVYTIRPPGAPGDIEPGQGKFIVVWKRIDGEWRIWADAFSALGEAPE